MKNKESIYSHIRESSLLPSLPHVLVKLIDVCDDESVPINAIAPIVAKDTSLTSRVLRLVNSAYFGFVRSFSNLDQAVVYLGAGTIKNLAITASVQQVFKGMKNSDSFKIGHFWYQSLLCATLSKRIAQALNYQNAEEAYLAGLLHNIGQLVLFVSFPEEYILIQQTQDCEAEKCIREEKLIGITHCEAGSWLLKKWKISPFIADAALYHHHIEEKISEGLPLVKIIYLASRISELPENETDNLNNLGKNLLNLGNKQLFEIIDGAEEEVKKIAKSLDVSIKIPTKLSQLVRKNGKPHVLSSDGNDTIDNIVDINKKDQELTQLVKNSLLLNGFLNNLLSTEGKDPILTATEEIIRILFGCESIFFLLFDIDTQRLIGNASSGNQFKELVEDLILPSTNSTSLAFRALAEKKIITSRKDGKEQPAHLADTQLVNIVSGEGMILVPMTSRQEPVGVIVVDIPAIMDNDTDDLHRQLQLIADQTAISLYLDDLQQKEARRLHIERLSTASLAARKVVHEVNNPLGIISNYLKLLEIKIPDNTDIHQELQVLDEEISRISTIINQLDSFTKTITPLAENIYVNDLLESLLRILDGTLLQPANIQLHFTPKDRLADIVTDKNRIKQVIINLVKNSAEAMTKGGTLSIDTANDIAGDTIRGIVITITDDGPGIPEDIQAKLFSPFMTTKKHGHSGLGLSIVHKTVTDLGGTIDCKSSAAKGTRFTISLPVNLTDIDSEL